MKSESQISGERLAAGKDAHCHIKKCENGEVKSLFCGPTDTWYLTVLRTDFFLTQLIHSRNTLRNMPEPLPR